MIKLKNVEFSYKRNRPLFEDLNLCLQKGHIYGLLGKNGSGKTTLLNLMSGLKFANSGEIKIQGIETYRRKAEVMQNVFLLPDEVLIPDISIKQYINTYSPFYPCFEKEMMMDILNQFEFENIKSSIKNLSLGQRKQVAIAFALACNTDILFMDEPTNGLDIPSKAIFRKLMASVCSENRIVVISTHQIRDLQSLIDSVIVLHQGKIIFNHSDEEILNKLKFMVVDDLSFVKNLVYAEENLLGSVVIAENINHEDSKLDIELLFNAIISNKEKMNQIFNI